MHSLVADPLFVDLENDDYRLKPESPAIRPGSVPTDMTEIRLRNRESME